MAIIGSTSQTIVSKARPPAGPTVAELHTPDFLSLDLSDPARWLEVSDRAELVPLLRELGREPLPATGRLDLEFVTLAQPFPGGPLSPAALAAAIRRSFPGDGRDRPVAYARFDADPAGNGWARWRHRPVASSPHPPVGDTPSAAGGGVFHPFEAAVYSPAAGPALSVRATAPDLGAVTSQLPSHVRFAKPLPLDGLLSVELVRYRPSDPPGNPKAVAAAVGEGLSRIVDLTVLLGLIASDSTRETTCYVNVVDQKILVRWCYSRPPGPQVLPAPVDLGHAQRVSGATPRATDQKTSGLDSALGDLRSPDPATWAPAAGELAFGDRPLSGADLRRLEAELAEDHPARELAAVLTALGRALGELRQAKLGDPDRIRALAGHPDPRVAQAARGVLTVLPEPPARASGGGPLVPLKDPAPAGSEDKRKPGRPIQTVRRLDAERFLTERLPALQAELDEVVQPAVERFGELLSELAGEAAETFEENYRLTEAVTGAARRYGVDLVYEKDGVRHTVAVSCTNPRHRGTGNFAIRTRSGAKHLANSATWPRLMAIAASDDIGY